MPFKNVILRLSSRQGDGGWFREGTSRRDAQELQPGGHVCRRDRADEAGGRHSAARERQRSSWKPMPARRSATSSSRFVLVIARDTTHAKQLLDLIESDQFFEGLQGQGHPG